MTTIPHLSGVMLLPWIICDTLEESVSGFNEISGGPSRALASPRSHRNAAATDAVAVHHQYEWRAMSWLNHLSLLPILNPEIWDMNNWTWPGDWYWRWPAPPSTDDDSWRAGEYSSDRDCINQSWISAVNPCRNRMFFFFFKFPGYYAARPNTFEFSFIVQSSGYCDEPPIVPNARHNAPQEQNSFAPDTELQYQCCKKFLYYFLKIHLDLISIIIIFLKNPKIDLGYNTLGFARARCLQYNQTVKWFGPDFKCEGNSLHFIRLFLISFLTLIFTHPKVSKSGELLVGWAVWDRI